MNEFFLTKKKCAPIQMDTVFGTFFFVYEEFYVKHLVMDSNSCILFPRLIFALSELDRTKQS